MNKIEIQEQLKAHVDYKGAVSICYFDIIKGKKIINKYNQGEDALFNSIVMFLSGDKGSIPTDIMLCNKNDNLLLSSIPYATTPILVKANIDSSGNITYETGEDGKRNCITFDFIVPKGSFKTTATGNINRLKLLDASGKLYASLNLEGEEEIPIDNASNIQIYWRLIFN